MAFTKTPEQDTHSKYRIRPIGNQSLSANTRDFDSYAGSKFVNCFPVIRESKTANPEHKLMKAPNLGSKTWTFPDTDVGITQFDYDTGVFIWKSKIYRAEDSGITGPTITLLKTDPAGGQFLTVQKAIDYALDGEILVTGLYVAPTTFNVYAYRYNLTTNALDIGPDLLAAGTSIYYTAGYSDDIYVIGSEEQASPRDLLIDGYHIVALKADEQGTNRVLVSHVATGDKSVNLGDFIEFETTTDYFTPEIDPDNLVDIQKHHNYICVIGTKTIEFFYNSAAEVGSPFVRQENYTLQLGAAQNLTANQGAVSINHGDDIYFFANAQNGGNAIYMIRDFKAIKVSDDYIDRLLNNAQGVTRDVNPAYAKLGLIDVMGTVNIGVELLNTTTGEITTYVFDENNKGWWEWLDSDGAGFKFTTRGIVSNFAGRPLYIKGQVLGIQSYAQYTVANVQANPTGSTLVLEYVTKDALNVAPYAMYITSMQDLDVSNWKHIKTIDAIGDYANNQIMLSWTKYADWSNWSNYQTISPSTLLHSNAMRWYNLGHARRFALRIQFVGTSQIAHDAFEVSYNIRTQ